MPKRRSDLMKMGPARADISANWVYEIELLFSILKCVCVVVCLCACVPVYGINVDFKHPIKKGHPFSANKDRWKNIEESTNNEPNICGRLNTHRFIDRAYLLFSLSFCIYRSSVFVFVYPTKMTIIST